jgi:hypothetical protein
MFEQMLPGFANYLDKHQFAGIVIDQNHRAVFCVSGLQGKSQLVINQPALI